MLNNKGQIFTTDLAVALTVLLFILVISAASFGLIQNSLNTEEFYSEMQEKAVNASQVLVTTEGKPDVWPMTNNLDGIDSIGLAKENNVLDENKVQTLVDWNALKYEEIKEVLGLQKYDFYFRVEEMNGQTVKEFGIMPEEQKTIVIERYVLFEGKERKFILGVFK